MRLHLKTTLFAVCCVLSAAFALGAPALAEEKATDPFKKGTDLLINTGAAAYGGTAPTVGLAGTVGAFINAALALLGIIFLVLMVYAGFRWMTAQGEAEVVQKSKDIITAAVIGLAIVLAAYAITNFVITRLTKAATDTTQAEQSGGG